MTLPFISRERFEALERALAEERIENRRLLDLLLAPLLPKAETVSGPAFVAETEKPDNPESPVAAGPTPMDRIVSNMHQHFKGATPPAQFRAKG